MSRSVERIEGKPRVAVHKFSSCDGCQLAFLNLGEQLLTLAQQVELVHFAEAGPLAEDEPVDIAFVEGSLSTPADLERIASIRRNSRYLITIGACATSGGLQALRNLVDGQQWVEAIYPSPQYIESLATSTAISEQVSVDWELWGCPISTRQLLNAIRSLLSGVAPVDEQDKVCLECKRRQLPCVMVTQNQPCLGPVTRTGCGALCPGFGRACYGCFGPAENINSESLGQHMQAQGMAAEAIARRFQFIHSQAPGFHEAGVRWRGESDDG